MNNLTKHEHRTAANEPPEFMKIWTYEYQ
jgi:hypothetical protein